MAAHFPVVLDEEVRQGRVEIQVREVGKTCRRRRPQKEVRECRCRPSEVAGFLCVLAIEVEDSVELLRAEEVGLKPVGLRSELDRVSSFVPGKIAGQLPVLGAGRIG